VRKPTLPTIPRPLLQAAGIFFLTFGVLTVNVARSLAPLDAMEYREDCAGERYSMASWRYWDDMAGAVNTYLRQTGPVQFLQGDEIAPVAYGNLTIHWVAQENIEPYEFWRTLPRKRWAREAIVWAPAPTEDLGRPMLASVGFRLLSGVSPYLLAWLGPLFAIPMLAWLCWSLCARAREPWAALVTAMLLAFSCYTAEILTLPHSAVGFHFLGVILLASLAVTLLSPPAPSRRQAGWFIGLGGLFFAIFTICRAGTGLVAPGFATLFLLYELRLSNSGKTAVLRAAAWTLLFLGPYLMVRPAAHHNVWTSVWEGLGDFGEDRGFSWHDRDAKKALRSAGIEPFENPKKLAEIHEAFFRERVIQAIRADPGWYATVLVRRALRTLSFHDLAPTCADDGQAASHPTSHYKYTTTAEHFGIGRSRHEFPFWVLPLPIVLLAGLAASGAYRRSPYWRTQGGIALVLIAGVLPTPVFISTYAGQETQMAVVLTFYAMGQLASLAGHRRPAAEADFDPAMRP
jgi:hypothetical protein